MKQTVSLTAVMAILICSMGSALGRPKPPSDATEVERPFSGHYFLGSAKAKSDIGKTGILVEYDVPEAAVLHTTQWIFDGDDALATGGNSKWHDVSPTVEDANHNPVPVGPTSPLPAGDYNIQFWAQTTGDIPPPPMKVSVVEGKLTTVTVTYTDKGCDFISLEILNTGSVVVAQPVSSSAPSGYGQFETVDGTAGHSTSWNIDGGSWRSTGTTLVVVYAGNHTIQFRANTAGDTPPATKVVSVVSTKLSKLTVTY
jgi:hypothetical protein